MRAHGVIGFVVVATAAFVLAGCGGASGPGASVGGGAAIAPADSVAFAAIDTDATSAQWNAVDSLLQKFPGRDQLFTKLQQAVVTKAGLDWNTDVKPALGPELDVAVLPQKGANGKPELVGLVQPADASKLDALLQKVGAKSGTQIVTTQVDGWTAFAASQAALDAVTGATTHLADDNTYQDATAKLATDALAKVYANGTEALQLAGSLTSSLPTTTNLSNLQWISADVVAESDGLKVDGHVRGAGGTATAPYASTLVSQIPAGALAVADVDASSIHTTGPLASALGGETAFYVSPGQPMPTVTLVTQPADPTAAAAAIDKAFSGLSSNPMLGKLSPILGAVQLQHEVVGGKLVVSTSQQAIADFQGGGAKLADDSAFKDATSAAGMPSQTNGFVYANLTVALPLVEGLAALGGKSVSSDLQANLAPLHSVTGYATRSGDETSFTLFLQIG
jgi:hypothetical protein